MVVLNDLSFLCSKPGVVVLLNNLLRSLASSRSLSVMFCTLQDVWIHISVVVWFFVFVCFCNSDSLNVNKRTFWGGVQTFCFGARSSVQLPVPCVCVLVCNKG